jgi:hypothetical protein
VSRGDRARRELAREHQPRSLKAGVEVEPRPSVADEERLTREVRSREHLERQQAVSGMLGHLKAAEREIRHLREVDQVDRLTHRDLDRVRKAIGRIRERYEASL